MPEDRREGWIIATVSLALLLGALIISGLAHGAGNETAEEPEDNEAKPWPVSAILFLVIAIVVSFLVLLIGPVDVWLRIGIAAAFIIMALVFGYGLANGWFEATEPEGVIQAVSEAMRGVLYC